METNGQLYCENELILMNWQENSWKLKTVDISICHHLIWHLLFSYCLSCSNCWRFDVETVSSASDSVDSYGWFAGHWLKTIMSSVSSSSTLPSLSHVSSPPPSSLPSPSPLIVVRRKSPCDRGRRGLPVCQSTLKRVNGGLISPTGPLADLFIRVAAGWSYNNDHAVTLQGPALLPSHHSLSLSRSRALPVGRGRQIAFAPCHIHLAGEKKRKKFRVYWAF